MDCRYLQTRLSEYVDGLLPVQEKAAIDEHLRSCPGCTAALADLRKTLEHLRDLETVEPPAWMAQNIMAKIRAEAQAKPSLFRKLFYPLHIKLPVGAIATVAIALTTLYVFRTIEPEVKLAKAPYEEAAPQILQREIIKEDRVRPLTRSGEGKPPLEITAASEKPPEEVVTGKAEMKADQLAQERVQEPGKKEEAKAAAPAKKLERAPAAGTIAKDEARQESGATAPKAKLSYMQEQEQRDLIFTVTARDPETAAKEIAEILKEVEGRELRIESGEGKKVVSAVFSFSKVHQLYQKLTVIGKVKEKEPDIRGQEGMARLTIEVKKYP